MSIAVLSHQDCLLHDNGKTHPERSQRIQVIQDALEQYVFNTPVAFYQAPLIDREHLKAVHNEAYVDWLSSISPHDKTIALDADTYMNPHTLNAAYRAAGAVVAAVDLVMQGEAQAAFCNVRPPGHHAERDKAMGFCLFNNIAVGVRYALENYGLNRILIVDFDVHHGNGTQDIFQEDHRVMLCSSFEHPFYPGYDETMDNEHILNLPLPAGTKGRDFREKVQTAWFSKIQAFQPELIFFSAGFDAHDQDPLADFALQVGDYIWLTQEIAKIAAKYCHGKMISVLEGGYNLAVLSECVPEHVNAMVLPQTGR